MITRSLLQCFLMLIFCCCLNAQNLIVNPGFEETTQDSDKPDYWLYRFANYHHIETNPANVYSGSKCAKFNNNSGSDDTCYYYSNYDITGTDPDFPSVLAGETYEVSIKYRVDGAFTGKGISVAIFFFEDTTAIGNVESLPGTSTTWGTIKCRGKIFGAVDKIGVGVYYDGKGIAWVDDVQLYKVADPLCINSGFETDITSPTDKPDYWAPRMTNYHHVETSAANTYRGNKAAQFNNTAGSSDACYYYGPYDAAGSTANYISVCPGDSYTISGFGRVDSTFIGNGIYLSLLFCNNSTYVDRTDSSYTTSTTWSPMTVDATVPAGANQMLYSAEYRGRKKAWIDEVRVVPKNLVKNSSFETDTTSPSDIPDYWLPRMTNYHHVDATVAYEGSKSAQFNNTSGTSDACYYYGPATAASAAQYIDVLPGETYTFSAWGKVNSNFTGSGIFVSIMFNNDNTYVSRADSAYSTSTNWTKMSVQATVPATGVNRISYSIEYRGCNKAWFDRAELYRTDVWYYQAAPISSLESLSFTPPSKLASATMLSDFYAYSDVLEGIYNGDGSWGCGYGVQSATQDYPNGHPLIRTTANAVLGYLRAYNKLDTAHKAVASARAYAGLEWLLNQQNADGGFDWWWSNPPQSDGGAALYEGGLAGQALARGYLFFSDSRYLTASNNICNYFLNEPPSANANYNALATSALAANYAITSNTNYLNRAILYMNAVMTYQLDSGMEADSANEYIYYHSIITKGLADLLTVIPSTYPKKAVISQSMYRALNHIRRMQCHVGESNVTPPYQPAGGIILEHPIFRPVGSGGIYCPHSTMAVAKAYFQWGIASDSLNTLTVGSQYFGNEAIQVYGFAALGMLLEYYY